MYFQEPYVCLYSRRWKFPRGHIRQQRSRGDGAGWLHLVDATCFLVTNFPFAKVVQPKCDCLDGGLIWLLLLKVYVCCSQQITHKHGEIIQLWELGNRLMMMCVVYVYMILTQVTLLWSFCGFTLQEYKISIVFRHHCLWAVAVTVVLVIRRLLVWSLGL